ncbi:conserved membrane protein of unknown function [Nitrospira japonica]|uniref:Uncharacterized protein n=1 Tax=Nitrospira japonica TaxID=1325564 RepID=A0A1W1I1F1_9BACT|nr:hypothetical protein [Nitrospira japonica]SLM46811.1 conserved membrane protein of unknown function [Nitrospira japonica]
MDIFSFKLGLLSFWGLWFASACSTNLCDGFRTWGIFHRTWPFASGNFKNLTDAIQVWSPPWWLSWLLFSAVVSWQLLAALLFGWAVLSSLMKGSMDLAIINSAFTVALGLWVAFMLVDEILKQYDTEHNHILFFMAQLLSFMPIYVLPS